MTKRRARGVVRGMRWSVVLVAIAVFVTRWVRVASACSCFTGVEPGAGRFYPKAGGVLPLDAPGIPWIADWSGKPRHKVTLERVQGDRRVLVKHRIVRREGSSSSRRGRAGGRARCMSLPYARANATCAS